MTVDSKSIAQREAVYGLLPVAGGERMWGFLDYTWVNVGLAIATWCFLIGGTMSLFVDLKGGFATALAGNTVAIALMALATTIPSCRYGVDQYVGLRSVFGVHGSKFALFTMIFVEFAWAAVLAIMFGRAYSNVSVTFAGGAEITRPMVIGLGVLAIVVSWLVVWKGPLSIKWLNWIAAPGLVIVLICMAYFIFRNNTLTELLTASPLQPFPDPLWNYVLSFELNLGAGFSWWPVMGGLARLTTSERAAFWPNMLGINLAAVLGEMVGLMSALAIGSSDPTEWMIPLGGPLWGVIALLFVGFGNVTSITAITYSTCLALKQLPIFLRMNWGKLTGGFFAAATLLVLFPDEVYSHFGSFLAVCGTFFGPLSGIYFMDYFVLRKQRISVPDLYKMRPDGAYWFWGGINWIAVGCFLVGVGLYFVILNPITFLGSSTFRFLSASVPSTGASMLLYYVVVRSTAVRSRIGGYR
ncbi:MAG TPA: hypothetical protein GX513_13445 [Firmicutes bacterium]|nr:hypothetical protein [Bacillota bacterium]